ncbi:AEC family transporter [Limibaculum sp. M0105]|uniref:AEC family transporter n=1 Tax=Thermohalobaculum xanthum TaxID=2753746 RepID=A0A8J7SFG1_9RHOB|nr:AEC family transporter [Thermohalobaculum xanthum]MBK0401252.1 AEC family transporter [Thermohalobaculum xanthum]
MLVQIFAITAPVFLLALAGFVWARIKAPFDLDFVTRLSLTFSVPCLMFATLVKAEIDPAAFRDVAVASLAAYVAAAVVFVPMLRLGGLSQRTWLAPVIFGNTGNVGLPVALFAFGDAGLALAMVVFAVMAILSFTIGIYMVAGVGRPSEALRQPLVYASVLGGLFAVMDWDLPDWLMSALSLAGQIAIPMMLLTLGVSIARLRVGDIGRAALISVLKYVVCGAAALGTAHAVGLSEVATGVLFLQLVMPVAVTNYMLAARYKRDPDAVAGLVVVSTVLSLAGIPVALAVFL